MRGRHVAPRTKESPASVRRLRKFTGSLADLTPTALMARAVVVAGTASLAVGSGLVAVDTPSVASVAGQASRGVVARTSYSSSTSATQQAAALLQEHLASASNQVSRSATRPPLSDGRQATKSDGGVTPKDQRAAKTASLSSRRQSLGGAMTKTVATPAPRDIAMGLLGSYGWDSSEFGCLDALWDKESGWNPSAENVSSGAYGIPQALPGSKMATVGSDWATNPETQIRWGLQYISLSYGSPCAAWSHSESYGWY